MNFNAGKLYKRGILVDKTSTVSSKTKGGVNWEFTRLKEFRSVSVMAKSLSFLVQLVLVEPPCCRTSLVLKES